MSDYTAERKLLIHDAMDRASRLATEKGVPVSMWGSSKDVVVRNTDDPPTGKYWLITTYYPDGRIDHADPDQSLPWNTGKVELPGTS